MNKIFIILLFALCLFFAGCSIISPALDGVTAETVIRYCSSTPAETRTYLRAELAQSCIRTTNGIPCGIAIRCPGDNWNDVIPTND